MIAASASQELCPPLRGSPRTAASNAMVEVKHGLSPIHGKSFCNAELSTSFRPIVLFLLIANFPYLATKR
jgi:hypothetical protein